jgi:hypothetical protein
LSLIFCLPEPSASHSSKPHRSHSWESGATLETVWYQLKPSERVRLSFNDIDPSSRWDRCP